MPNPFSAVGTRPWMRKTKAKKNANTTVEKAGELIIDDEGNLYGTNGVTQTKDLSPVVTQATADANYANVDAYVIFRDQDGDELPEGSVVEIRVNTATSEIDDIIYTAPEA